MRTIIEHEGKVFLVCRAYGGAGDGWEDFETATIELTQGAIDLWRRRIALGEQLHKEHGIHNIEFFDYSAKFRPSDHEADSLDEDDTMPPKWDEEPGRTDGDRMVVQHCGNIYWESLARYADYPVIFETGTVYRSDLDYLEIKLNEIESNRPVPL